MMTERDVVELDAMVGALKAAGESTRLRLIALLSQGELSVKDLTEILGQSQPRVSRHLKLLADAGLVVRQAEGAWAYYGLARTGAEADFANWLIGRLDLEGAPARDRARLERVRAEQQAQAAAYFSTVAESWDALRTLHVPESAVEAAILETVDGRETDLMLDLGTGTGRMLELLADRYRRGVGLDSSREMIAVARAKLVSAGIGHAQVRLGDIAALDPGAGPADLIVFHQVLHYFDDPGRAISAAAGALAPGGAILVVDFAPHGLEFLRERHAHRRLGLSGEQIREWAAASGLGLGRQVRVPRADDKEELEVCLWLLTAGPEKEPA